jgi:hypothetical protein
MGRDEKEGADFIHRAAFGCDISPEFSKLAV